MLFAALVDWKVISGVAFGSFSDHLRVHLWSSKLFRMCASVYLLLLIKGASTVHFSIKALFFISFTQLLSIRKLPGISSELRVICAIKAILLFHFYASRV